MATEPAPDTSMEDILASIRRIISDGDDARKPPPPPLTPTSDRGPAPLREAARGPREEFPSASPAAKANDIIRADRTVTRPISPSAMPPPASLTDSGPPTRPATTVLLGSADEHAAPTGLAASVPSPLRRASGPAQPPAPAAAPPVAEAARGDAALLSPGSGAAVQAAFGQLSDLLAGRDGRSMDEVVKELMRPILREWLDTNLPALVERLVREEIQRLSRGRG